MDKSLEAAGERKPGDILDFSEIGRIDPPKLDDNLLDLEVVHVNNPNSFWVQYCDDTHQALMGRMESQIKAVMADKTAPRVIQPKQVKKNGVYLVPFHDGNTEDYYRAKVEA